MAEVPAIRPEDFPRVNENFVEITAALGRFRAAMQALRDLLRFIDPHEATLDDAAVEDGFISRVLAELPAERHPDVAVAMIDFLIDMSTPVLAQEGLARLARLRALVIASAAELAAGRQPDPVVVEEILAFDYSGLTPMDTQHPQSDRFDMDHAISQMVKMANALGDVRAAMSLSLGLARRATRVSRVATVRRALVVDAVTAFEILLGAIFTAFYREHPTALDALEKSDTNVERLSASELVSFETVEELRDAIVERRVDALLRGGLNKWENWFVREVQIGPDSLVTDWPAIAEVFYRRHLFVHTGGRVTREYVKLTRSTRIVGSSLDASAAYVGAAIDGLTVLGTLLAAQAQCKWWKEFRSVVTESTQQVLYDEFMSVGMWGPVAPICAGMLALGIDDVTVAPFSANRWLGLKRVGALRDEDRQELLAWDTSALLPMYALVRLSLLDDLDELFLRLPYALAAGQISQDALQAWPVFAELRADSRFAALIAERG